MLDLGKYAGPVLSAYATSLTFLILFVIWTLHRGRKVRAEMEATEARKAAKSSNG